MSIFKNIREGLKIEVILQELDADQEMYKNNILICNVILNLLNRFLTKIRYVGDREVLRKYFPASFAQSLKLKNFTDEDPVLSIIIGNEEKKVNNPLYVSSNGWSIYLSRKRPCPWRDFTQNPLSAIYIAALVVGEIFKLLVKNFVKVEIIEEFIFDFITYGKGNQPIREPNLPPYLDLNLALIGCGGVSQAVCFALSQFELRGRISFIDYDYIDESNKQRYFLVFDEYIGMSKTQYLTNFLLGHENNLLTTLGFILSYEEAISINESMFNMTDVIISVDNKKTRIALQAALPKVIWNVWTDTQLNVLRYGIGKHEFLDEYQCLACAYYPRNSSTPSKTELEASILGLTQEEFLHRKEQNDLIKEEDLSHIFNNHQLRPEQAQKLNTLIGQPFQNIIHGQCGVFNIPLGEKHEPTPATHIPLLAGTYVIIQYIIDRLNCTKGQKFKSITDFDALAYPTIDCFIKKIKEHNCICSDPIYQDVFKKKWELQLKLK